MGLLFSPSLSPVSSAGNEHLGDRAKGRIWCAVFSFGLHFFLTCLYKVAIVNQVNLVSIRTSDPHLPGTFYLTKDGNWSPDKNKAQRIPDQQIPTIMRQLKGFSKRVRIVVEDLQSK